MTDKKMNVAHWSNDELEVMHAAYVKYISEKQRFLPYAKKRQKVESDLVIAHNFLNVCLDELRRRKDLA